MSGEGHDDMRRQMGPHPLRGAAIFRHLEAHSLAELAAHARRRVYVRGEIIAGLGADPSSFTYAGGADEALHLVGGGRVRLYRLSREGREVTLAVLHAGDAVGLDLPGHAVGATGLVEALLDGTVIYSLPRREALRALAAHPEALLGALELAGRRTAEAYDRIEELACHSVKERLARTLARLAPPGQPVVMATRDDLAALVGASREEVSRALRQLRDLGLVAIQPHRRGILVRDRDRLASL